MNRRTFLRSAAAGMGTLALPGTRAHAAASDRQANSRQPTSTRADVVVVGAGSFGGWTALYLREMGVNVTMIDAYGAGNARSSSGGESRQIRAGHGDQEYYTRWVVEAFARWKKRQTDGAARSFRDGPSFTRSGVDDGSQGDENRPRSPRRRGPSPDPCRRGAQVSASRPEGIALGMYGPAPVSSKRGRGARPLPMPSRKKGGASPLAGFARAAGRREAARRRPLEWTDGCGTVVRVRARTVVAQRLSGCHGQQVEDPTTHGALLRHAPR